MLHDPGVREPRIDRGAARDDGPRRLVVLPQAAVPVDVRAAD
ncbi:hypothetical protein ACFXGR_50745 [Streptomyces mirabilis]